MQGLTIVTLSFERRASLVNLLRGIQNQKLDDLNIELILCNNSSRYFLKPSRFSKIGRVLNGFHDVKIFNSSHNWRDAVRYPLATLARYETVLILDDDIHLLDNNFILDMYKAYQKLEPTDILSCWNSIWSDWNNGALTIIPVNLWTPSINNIIPCDTCGTGIAMYNRNLVMNQQILDVVVRPQFPNAYDYGFGIIAQMIWGGSVYYFPAFGRLDFHRQHTSKAIHQVENFHQQKLQLLKTLWKAGYQPVLERKDELNLTEDSPFFNAIQSMSTNCYKW